MTKNEFCKHCLKDFPTPRGVFIHQSKCFFRPDNYRGGQIQTKEIA